MDFDKYGKHEPKSIESGVLFQEKTTENKRGHTGHNSGRKSYFYTSQKIFRYIARHGSLGFGIL